MFTATDYTFDVEKQLNWACIEVNAGIVCASIPALKPFFVRYLPMFVHSHLTGSARKSGAAGGPNGAASASHRNYQTSAPYSTTVENNKRRRNVQSEAYELHSHDELSLSSSNEMPHKPGGGGGGGAVSEDDDVAKLWSGNAFHRDRGQGGHRQTIIESTPRDTDGSSVGSLEGVRPAVGVVGLALPGRATSVRASGGIKVTTETRVVYEQS